MRCKCVSLQILFVGYLLRMLSLSIIVYFIFVRVLYATFMTSIHSGSFTFLLNNSLSFRLNCCALLFYFGLRESSQEFARTLIEQLDLHDRRVCTRLCKGKNISVIPDSFSLSCGDFLYSSFTLPFILSSFPTLVVLTIPCNLLPLDTHCITCPVFFDTLSDKNILQTLLLYLSLRLHFI